MRRTSLFVSVFLLAIICGPASAADIDAVRMRQVDKVIEQAIADGNAPGAVLLVGWHGRTVYEKAYGCRSIELARTPMTVDTIFDLASLSKPVGCATSIMLLAERGKLRLGDPVAKYIPAFSQNGKEKITIADLLLHRGGLIPDNPMADYQDGPAAALKKIFALKPLRQPGKSFWYSDMGYVVLGQVVQAADGRPLDRFAAEEIFRPLGMNDTMYNPPAELRSRCAPTEKRGAQGEWMVGEVHDPRSYALGGVAGHAGVFSTAQDLARFCWMILGVQEGLRSRVQSEGSGFGVQGSGNSALPLNPPKRILSQQTLRDMLEPHYLPTGEGRCYGFDMDTAYSGCRGDRFDIGTTFGHSGFTGTSFWMDQKNQCFVILLTNSVHPNGKGKVLALRHEVATIVADALLGPIVPVAGESVRAAWRAPQTQPAAQGKPAEVLCGIDVLTRDGFKLLDGRKIAIVTNHSGRDREGNRTVDLLFAAKNVTVVKLFSPEHGLYGAVDEKVADTVDAKTGLKVFSLYGKTVRPTDEMMEGVDTIVYDIQDVGARFYTFITTLGYCMEAAAKHKARMVVLDRPNPITGLIVDGPLADKDNLSFIAYMPMPVAHGMTVGELAAMYNQEMHIGCDLSVVKMEGWKRTMWFDETGLMWVNPSPNMRNLTQALLYPGVCLLEAANISVGRGTDQPFETFGAPWIDGRKLAGALNGANLPGLRFIPIEFTPASSKFKGEGCQGVYILVTDRSAVEPVRAGVVMAWTLRNLFGEKFQVDRVGHLLRNAEVLEALKQTRRPEMLARIWRGQGVEFRGVREKYLLYR